MEKETCERKGPCILGINVGLGIKGSTPMLLCLERIKISKAIEEEIVGTESQGGKTTKRTIKGQTTRYHRTEKEKGKKRTRLQSCRSLQEESHQRPNTNRLNPN
jgi:hypothetical protein